MSFLVIPCLLLQWLRGIAALESQFLDVHVISEGRHDPSKTAGFASGKATIVVNGTDYSLSKLGHNIVAVNSDTGKVIQTASFNTHGDRHSSSKMFNFINSLPDKTIVLVAIQNDGFNRLSEGAIERLRKMASDVYMIRMLGTSFALIGYKGSPLPSWVLAKCRMPGRGPSDIKARIPLRHVSLQFYIRSEGCSDPSVTRWRGNCGKAIIQVDNKDFSLHKRGVNIIAMSYQTGDMIKQGAFDTHGNINQAKSLRHFIDTIPSDSIVAVAFQDEASVYLSKAWQSLLQISGTRNNFPSYRSSYALLGYKGSRAVSWTKNVYASKAKGPSIINQTVTLKTYLV